MQIGNIMNQPLSTIEPNSTVLEAFERVEQQRSRALVVAQSDRVLGVVTKTAVDRRVVADEKAASTQLVRDVMTIKVAACFEDTEVNKARALMQHKGIQHILVCNRQKQIIGLLSPEDLKRAEN